VTYARFITKLFLAAIRRPHRLMVDHVVVRPSSVVAASYNAVRVMASPALVIWPVRSISPDW
jgi:hypothetical protein